MSKSSIVLLTLSVGCGGPLETVGEIRGPVAGAGFGTAVRSGDFDGDGFDDLVVSAPYERDDVGGAWVYPGSVDGLRSSPSHRLAGVGCDGRFGTSLAVGDFDDDGFDDVVVGAPGVEAARIHLGSPDGLSDDAVTVILPSPASGVMVEGFGELVAAADVDGDGYDDVVVTAHGTSGGGDSFQIFRGGSDGVDGQPWQATAVAWVDRLAPDLAGDVDGDGYDDLALCGAVYRGSPSQMQAPIARKVEAIVGDVDGDGFDDAIGEIPADPGQCPSGVCTSLQVSAGSAEGLAVPSDPLTPSLDYYANVAGPGDVDGDGYDDVVVAEPYGTEPRVYLYSGSSAGLSSEPAAVWTGPADEVARFGAALCGGDFDGDGRAEVAVASPGTGLSLSENRREEIVRIYGAGE